MSPEKQEISQPAVVRLKPCRRQLACRDSAEGLSATALHHLALKAMMYICQMAMATGWISCYSMLERLVATEQDHGQPGTAGRRLRRLTEAFQEVRLVHGYTVFEVKHGARRYTRRVGPGPPDTCRCCPGHIYRRVHLLLHFMSWLKKEGSDCRESPDSQPHTAQLHQGQPFQRKNCH